MKTRIIKRKSIEDFVVEHTRARTGFEIWLTVLKYADWYVPADMIKTFGTADILGKGSKRVVFNIAGNHFPVICGYHFGKTVVHLYIKWIGTHAEYTSLCNKNEQYTISNF